MYSYMRKICGDMLIKSCTLGTTSNGAYMLKFRTGAFLSGSRVVPIYFRYPFKHFSCAFESISTPVFFFRLLTQFYNALEVDYLDTYVPSEEEKQDPVLFAENVREAIYQASHGKGLSRDWYNRNVSQS